MCVAWFLSMCVELSLYDIRNIAVYPVPGMLSSCGAWYVVCVVPGACYLLVDAFCIEMTAVKASPSLETMLLSLEARNSPHPRRPPGKRPMPLWGRGGCSAVAAVGKNRKITKSSTKPYTRGTRYVCLGPYRRLEIHVPPNNYSRTRRDRVATNHRRRERLAIPLVQQHVRSIFKR